MIPVYATEQTNSINRITGQNVGVIRVAFKRSNDVWQIGSTLKRGDRPAVSNLWLDPAEFDFVGSLRLASKGPL